MHIHIGSALSLSPCAGDCYSTPSIVYGFSLFSVLSVPPAPVKILVRTLFLSISCLKSWSRGLRSGSKVRSSFKQKQNIYMLTVILWVTNTTQTQLFLITPKKPLAGEWPKLFRENNVEITRFVWWWCPPVFGKFSQRADAQ